MDNPIAVLAETVRLRTYARRSQSGDREKVSDMENRVIAGLEKLGKYTEKEIALIRRLLGERKVYPSGRYLWVGGTSHTEKPENYPSLYNCVSIRVDDPSAFGLLFDLAMQGCGTGAVLEDEVKRIPQVVKRINKVTIVGAFGAIRPGNPETLSQWTGTTYRIQVGDSRQGWVDAYQKVINFALGLESPKRGMSELVVDISHVRPKGQALKGFGGVSNPDALPNLFTEMVRVLNSQLGKPWEPINICYLIDLAAYQAVAGNIRRSAGMRQFSAGDQVAATSKDNLWKCGEDGVWRIDPEWDALRMANHTRVYHTRPTYDEVLAATTKQYYYGEGAIQWAGEAVFRANTDYCKDRTEFLRAYETGEVRAYLEKVGVPVEELDHRVRCYGINPCVTGDTWIHTATGPQQVKELIGDQFTALINGIPYQSTDEGFWYTGDKQVYLLETTTGHTLKCTADHKVLTTRGKVAASDLKPDHEILLNSTEATPVTQFKQLTPLGVEPVYDCTIPGPHVFSANGMIISNCGEIVGNNFFCNLSEIHLNQLDPNDHREQYEAFYAGGLLVASLLHHQFTIPRFQESREIDPIVGVSFTGLFDFFIKALGPDWLRWVVVDERERKSAQGQQFHAYEVECLTRWRLIARDAVKTYCDRVGIRCPNRITTVQPAGTKSILTGASSGWHPDKAKRYIRRVTFRAHDPVALAARDLGYKVIPSQNSKHADGRLMDDPYDPLCGEWLVEYPIEKPWANYKGLADLDLSDITIKAQWDLYMTVQQHYTDHNTSATLELREHEIPTLATLIYEAIRDDAGYSSAAVLARFDDHQTFPRLPFEPISKDKYDQEIAGIKERCIGQDLMQRLTEYDRLHPLEGPAGCDSAACLL